MSAYIAWIAEVVVWVMALRAVAAGADVRRWAIAVGVVFAAGALALGSPGYGRYVAAAVYACLGPLLLVAYARTEEVLSSTLVLVLATGVMFWGRSLLASIF